MWKASLRKNFAWQLRSNGTDDHGGGVDHGNVLYRVLSHAASSLQSSKGTPVMPASHSAQQAISFLYPTFIYERVS